MTTSICLLQFSISLMVGGLGIRLYYKTVQHVYGWRSIALFFHRKNTHVNRSMYVLMKKILDLVFQKSLFHYFYQLTIYTYCLVWFGT